MITATVYGGTSSAVIIRVLQNGEPINFSAVTRITADFEGSAVVVDSDDSPDSILWNSSGEISLILSDFGIAAGDRRLGLTVYDAGHTSGQRLIDPAINHLVLRFL
jgi:hypothetical protein